MGFPTVLPKKVAEAGRQLVAQLRFESKNSFTNDHYVFVVLSADGYYCVVYGGDDCDLTFQVVGRSKFQVSDSLEFAVAKVCEIMGSWERDSALMIAECECWYGTEATRSFVDKLLRELPSLRAIVRFANGETPDIAPEPETKPVRTILSRSDWMARHYPNRVVA